MNENEMSGEQYNKLAESISQVNKDLNKLHTAFSELDQKVTSIGNWISGDPNIARSEGVHDKVERLEERLALNTRELERVHRIDDIETKLDDHEMKINKIFTSIAVIGVVATVLGFFIGMTIPIIF